MNTNDESQPAAESESPAAKRWPKHAVWIGPLLTVVGAMSYFLFFVRFPSLRDFPVVNLPLVLLGLALTAAGCVQMFRRHSRVLGKAFASLGLLLSAAVAGLFSFYIFFLSYQMPAAAAVPELGVAAPDFALVDQNDSPVQLSDFRGSKVVLVFYRGHW